MDGIIALGLLQKEKVDRFWRAVLDAILDRMTRRVLKKRSGIHEEEAKAYAEAKEPLLDLEHLQEHTRVRIENLGELMELRNRM